MKFLDTLTFWKGLPDTMMEITATPPVLPYPG
jgi:hypothetical protein